LGGRKIGRSYDNGRRCELGETMILEKNLNQLFERLPMFYRKLHPHRLHNGEYVEGEPFDYLVMMGGETFCFDAKECASSVLYLSKIPLSQFNNLLKAEKHGATVFFLIYFVENKKMAFVHPKTILKNDKATSESEQVENNLKKVILRSLCNT
jgi:penicillin-binding protein-related factor A (putative recombinase)